MDDEDFCIDHHGARFMFEAMMYAGGFRVQCSRECSSPELSPIRRHSISPELRKGEVEVLPYERFQGKIRNYSEIAEKNAQALIKEEEQAKLRAEKKKAKKERQKNKKKETAETSSAVNYCLSSDNAANKISNDMENLILNSDNKESTEGLDINAAFLSKAIKKVKTKPIIPDESKEKKEERNLNNIIEIAKEYEKKKQFTEAAEFYSEAVGIDPKRFDLFLKRSYLYFQLGKFEKSARDSLKVVKNSLNNVEGYYRLGEAHFALNNWSEAEAAFTKLISLNSYRNEAENRLFSIHHKQLEVMGYHPNEAYTALLKSKNKTLDEAIEYLKDLEDGKINMEDIYYSDIESEEECEDFEEVSNPVPSTSVAATNTLITMKNRNLLLTDPTNPIECCSLFVGNLKKDITYKEVYDIFIKFGDLKNIKLNTNPNCYAFVNYVESSSAGQAMGALQDSRWLLSTMPLTIKYPTNIINKLILTLKNPEVIISRINALQSAKPPVGRPVVKPTEIKPVVKPTPVFAVGKPAAYNKLTVKPVSNGVASTLPVVQPPIAGKARPKPQTEECFYWRTLGCTYGDKCFNLHIPGHQGIDYNSRKALH